MGKAHEIAIAADAQAFDQGIRDGVIKPLDKAEEALKDLGDAAGDAGRDGARGMDKLEDALKDAQRQAKRTEDAVDDIGEGGHRGFGKAGEAASEFKQEALQNLSEVTSSFDGSIESVTDLVQGTLGGIASSIPGIGLLGAGAALGVGAIGAAFAANDEAAKASEARAAEWADAYVEAGGRILSASQIMEKARAIVTDPEQYKKAQQAAKDWGVDESSALLAMAGDTNALAEARSSLSDKERDVAGALEAAGGNMRNLNHEQRTAREEASAGRETLSQLTGEMDRGAQGADVYSTSLKLLANHTEGATRVVDEFGDTVVTLPDGKQIYIDAETGKATDNVNAIEKRIYGVPEGHHTTFTASADLSQAEAAINELLNRDLRKSIDIVVNTVTNLGGSMK